MALAGWDVNKSTAALTPVLKLAEATQGDLATTSDLVTDSMSAMGVGIEDLQPYLDTVVKTNNKANTSAAELMEAYIGVGGAAKAAGLDYKATATALGIMANNGLKGAQAGTALNSILVRMTSKDTALNAYKKLGVSIYDTAGNTRDFGDILKDIRMKKARSMLKSSSATVESIAESVGYQNVEHFNRTFKKLYNITPVQYRNKP